MALLLCCAWIFILLLPGLSDGGKLLVMPMDGSHWLSMRPVVEKLTERGHEVVVLIPEVSWRMGTAQAYTVKTYPVSYTLEELDNAFHEYVATHLKDLPFPLNVLALYNSSVHVFNVLFVQCKNLFSNKETLQYLNQSNFDAVLTDPIFMCGATLAHYFSLPFVFFMRGFPCNLHYEAPQCPSPLSYTPRLFTFNLDHMTFFQRVENALVSLLELVYCNGFYGDAIKFSSEVLQRDVSLLELLNSASIWLLRFDFVFEFVRPVMPNMIFIGGINCAQRKPLSKSLLHNKDMMQYLRESKFDLVFTDPILMCGPIIAEYLSVPSVYFLRGFPCGMDFEATQCPNPPSYVPRLFLNNSDSMTFAQRVKNMLVHMLEFVYCKPVFAQFEDLAYEIFQKKVTATDLLSRGSVWLMRYDFVFEFPRPVMPNMVFIGGINCGQKKKLSQVKNFGFIE
ncbi:PREDICTED: UDP-glucuronosyltransferase 1-6-like [Eurypyga helias]|nr:PREDICTED: UDP-glucuronosyltransferase 1-6-like [Eurypyga helias]